MSSIPLQSSAIYFSQSDRRNGTDPSRSTPFHKNNLKAEAVEEASEDSDQASRLVLVVEDERANVALITRILKKLGFTCDVANNGRDALQCVNNKDYDLVLMDVQMPVMDGIEATQRIRSGEAGDEKRTVRIFAVTANAMSDNREKCLNAGMNYFLTKPISLPVLKKVLLSNEE